MRREVSGPPRPPTDLCCGAKGGPDESMPGSAEGHGGIQWRTTGPGCGTKGVPTDSATPHQRSRASPGPSMRTGGRTQGGVHRAHSARSWNTLVPSVHHEGTRGGMPSSLPGHGEYWRLQQPRAPAIECLRRSCSSRHPRTVGARRRPVPQPAPTPPHPTHPDPRGPPWILKHLASLFVFQDVQTQAWKKIGESFVLILAARL